VFDGNKARYVILIHNRMYSIKINYLFQNPRIPEPFRMPIVEHVVHVHTSADAYTQEFLLKLRRRNYVTPKHYLDFINTYLKLLDEKIICIKAQVREELL
jgi:dynein heavy chain